MVGNFFDKNVGHVGDDNPRLGGSWAGRFEPQFENRLYQLYRLPELFKVRIVNREVR